jgi:uncharacterized membrane protein HdeD (DUF308 family)
MSNQTPDTRGFVYYDNGLENTKQAVRAIQAGLVLGAVLAAVFGALILTATAGVLTLVAIFIGLYFLIRGLFRLVTGIFAPGLTAGGRTLSIIFGVLLIVLGVFALKNLDASLAILGILIGLSWLIDGIVTLVESGHSASRGFSIFIGLVSIIAGIVVLTVPIGAVEVLTLITGIFLVVIAIAQAIAAIYIGIAAKKAS